MMRRGPASYAQKAIALAPGEPHATRAPLRRAPATARPHGASKVVHALMSQRKARTYSRQRAGAFLIS
eukprot:4074183-Prymnesium_polylepis.1